MEFATSLAANKTAAREILRASFASSLAKTLVYYLLYVFGLVLINGRVETLHNLLPKMSETSHFLSSLMRIIGRRLM